MQIQVFRTRHFSRTPTERSALDPRSLKTLHSHFTYEIFFVTEGKLELITDGGRETFERRVVIIRPRVKHYSTSRGQGSFSLLFSPETEHKPHSLGTFRELLETSGERGVICDFPITDAITLYVHKLSEICDEGLVASDGESEMLLSLIFCEIVRALSTGQELLLTSRAESAHISEIEGYINRRISHKITLSDVAAQVFLSTRQVARILQKEYGCTLAELLLEKRLAIAELLLKNTDMKVCDIAKQSGIGSENYFYLLFKRQFGMSPLQFRKEHKK